MAKTTVTTKLRMPLKLGEAALGQVELVVALDVDTASDGTSIVITPRIDGAQVAGALGDALTKAAESMKVPIPASAKK